MTTLAGDLTEEAAISALRAFFRETPLVIIGTGMSCAIDERFGMAALKDELCRRMALIALGEVQTKEWEAVEQKLQNGVDLEQAANEISDQDLLKMVTAKAGEFIAYVDREYSLKMANCEAEWPATHLLKRLVTGLSDGDPVLNILTPNYDMLIEYACCCSEIPYANGFFGGFECKTDWEAVTRSMLVPQKVRKGQHQRKVFRLRKHVRLHKVHGSLNYFFHRNTVVENNAWMWNPPAWAQRVLITPGLSKYQTLHGYRQELLSKADAAVERSNRFLFLGYGFNDTHIENYIRRKLIAQNVPGIVVTRDSNPRIEELLAAATNLWLVCKPENAGGNGTLIRNARYPKSFSIPNRALWDIREFERQILGG